MGSLGPSPVLPPNLRVVLDRYKKGTDAIVTWLCEGVPESQIEHGCTIKDLQRFSNDVCAKGGRLPNEIAFHFKETIRHRERLSQHHRKIDNSARSEYETIKHEFFTEKLREMYFNLCAASNRSNQELGQSRTKPNEHPNSLASKGAYDLLQVEECNEEAYPVDDESEPCDAAVYSTDAETKKRKAPELVDDDLGKSLELLTLMKDLDETFALVRKAWEKAARNEVPLALAAFTTHRAYVSLKAYESQFRVLLDFAESERSGGSSSGPGKDVGVIGQMMLMHGSASVKRVQGTYLALQGIKKEAKDTSTLETGANFQRPSDCLSETWNPTAEQEKQSVCTLFGNIMGLICCHNSSEIMEFGSPLSGDLDCFFLQMEGKVDVFGLKISIGFQLLLQGSESFTWPEVGGPMTQKQPRVQSLRFAGEVLGWIKQVLEDKTMPCRCHSSLTTSLEEFQKDLEKFLRERRFDLFVQCPWTSGSHMLVILETSFEYSMRLCSYKHLFSELLHLYNCLCSIGEMEKIPALEMICSLFEEVVFPGGRPKSAFLNSYARSKGARLKQSKKDRRRWNLETSALHLREMNGLGHPGEPVGSRFKYENTSLLHLIKSKEFQVDNATLQSFFTKLKQQQQRLQLQLQQNQQQTQMSEKNTRGTASENKGAGPKLHSKAEERSTPGDDGLLELQEVIARCELVSSECNPLPTGRINYFKLYLAVVRVMKEISDKTHDEQHNEGTLCTCSVDKLLKHGDAFVQHKMHGTGKFFTGAEAAKRCNEAMLKEFDMPRESWGKQLLWEHL